MKYRIRVTFSHPASGVGFFIYICDMALADDLNTTIDAVIARFRIRMERRGQVAWNRVKKEISNINTNEKGNLIEGTRTNSLEVRIDTALTNSLNTQEFQKSVDSMQASLEPMRRATIKYYTDKFKENPPQQALRLSQGLVTTTKNDINNEIRNAGFRNHVIDPATAALRGHVSAGSTLDATEEDLEHRIKSRIQTFTDIKAVTLMQQYARRMNDIFGSLNGRVAKYAGPNDSNTRDFCAVRAGNKYTRAEIASWGRLDWEGKIPGTDRGSIFVNLGGFNCRHILEWEQ